MNRTKRFIIDTNTLISGLLIKNSIPFQAIEKAHTQGSIIFSEETFLEFELVLFRKKFDRYFSKEERLNIIQKMYNDGSLMPVTSDLKACRDEKDNKFLNLAVDSSATNIITGDNDLLILHPFHSIPILSPLDFLKSS